MSAVSETIVREFFEGQEFLVRQLRKHVGHEEEEIDFLVANPRPIPGPLPFELAAADLPRLHRAIVAVRGWHTETFGPGLLANAPELFRFVEPAAVKAALAALGSGPPPTRILVVPALTPSREAREQTIALLRARGVDAVLSFRILLEALIHRVEVNRNYAKSDLLQTLRILKNYGLLKDPQLELFQSPRAASRTRTRGASAPAATNPDRPADSAAPPVAVPAAETREAMEGPPKPGGPVDALEPGNSPTADG